jgi:hypothetical protein
MKGEQIAYRETWVPDEHGTRSVIVTDEMVDAALSELRKFEIGTNEREALFEIIAAALRAAFPPATIE